MTSVGFSTLGCPEWDLEQVLDMANQLDVHLLEIRFLNGRIVDARTSYSELENARQQLDRAEVTATTLATGIHLAKGEAAADELRRLLDAATILGCSNVRVFAGESDPPASLESMAAVLAAVATRAKDAGLRIALETHDRLRAGRDAAQLIKLVDHEAVGIIWDTVHTAAAGESAAETWAAVAATVVEIQVKDAVLSDPVLPVLLGNGAVPWRQAVALALKSGFAGPFMLEWEKAWHRDLADPEIATPYELAILRSALSAVR